MKPSPISSLMHGLNANNPTSGQDVSELAKLKGLATSVVKPDKDLFKTLGSLATGNIEGVKQHGADYLHDMKNIAHSIIPFGGKDASKSDLPKGRTAAAGRVGISPPIPSAFDAAFTAAEADSPVSDGESGRRQGAREGGA